MACCLAIAFVFATLRRVPGVGGRSRGEPAHAPQARRGAPGAALPAATPRPTTRTPAGRPTGLRPAGLLLGAGLGTVLYAVLVVLLFAGGVAQSISTEGVDRLPISVTLLTVATLVIAAAARRAGPVHAGRIAMGIGLALELLSLLDMHFLSPFELAGGSTLTDVAFHGLGPAIAVAGALHEVRPLRRAPAVAVGSLR